MSNLHLRDAASKPSSWNPETRTIDAVIASDAPVNRRDAQGEFLEILDPKGADLANLVGASVLDAHRQGNVRDILGVVEAARVEGNTIVATLRMSERPEIQDIVQDIGSGILRNLSVGYSVSRWATGVDAASNKRTRTATKWSPKEISFVPVGADSNAKTRMQEMPDTIIDRKPINRQLRELGTRSGCASVLIDGLIDREASVDEARAEILADIHKRGSIKINSASDHQSFDDPEFFRNSVGDALLHRIDPKTKPSEAAKQYVGLSIPELTRVMLQRVGVNTTGLGADALISRAMNTTSDFPAVMANVLDKSLRVAYEAAPAGLKEVARQTTNVDFRAKMRVMLDSTGLVLEAVPESGEFKRGTMMDASESYAVATYGKIFNISRQALVNDDLNAFGDISRRLGIAAAQFEATTLANLVTSNPTMAEDGLALFCTTHGNIAATGAAPSVSTLSDARLAMRHQKGIGGGTISVTPMFFVVPPELETVADQLVFTINPIQVADVNPFQKLRVITEPRLPAYGWYLTASPAEIDGLEFAYLASSPGPQLESRLGFEVDGLETRVRLDFGGGFVDWRGWYYNAGH